MKILPHFLRLVLLYSVPLWLAGALFDTTKVIPVKLPLSALQFLSVLLAAVVSTRRSGGSVRALLLRGLDVERIKSPFWRSGILLLMPLIVALSYLMVLLSGDAVSHKMTPLLSAPIFLLVYGISAYCEQIGWTAVMTDDLLERHAVPASGLIVGLTWAAWHVLPFIQTHNTARWIFWQCTYTVIYRVLLTQIYVLTNRSVFSTIALHATYNTAFSLMPYYGSSYSPLCMGLATLGATGLLFRQQSIRT